MKANTIQPKLNTVALVNVGPLVRRSIRSDDTIKRDLSDARRRVDQLRKHLEKFSERHKELEAQDKLGNFEIQDLMSRYNQAETLASNVIKKRDDTANTIIGKI